MAGRTKADLEQENEDLRAKLEHAHDIISEALGYEDEDDEDDEEEEDDD